MPTIQALTEPQKVLFEIASAYAEIKRYPANRIDRIVFRPMGTPPEAEYHPHVMIIVIGDEKIVHRLMCSKINEPEDFLIEREVVIV